MARWSGVPDRLAQFQRGIEQCRDVEHHLVLGHGQLAPRRPRRSALPAREFDRAVCRVVQGLIRASPKARLSALQRKCAARASAVSAAPLALRQWRSASAPLPRRAGWSSDRARSAPCHWDRRARSATFRGSWVIGSRFIHCNRLGVTLQKPRGQDARRNTQTGSWCDRLSFAPWMTIFFTAPGGRSLWRAPTRSGRSPWMHVKRPIALPRTPVRARWCSSWTAPSRSPAFA